MKTAPIEVGPRPGHHPRTEGTDNHHITSHAKADTAQYRCFDDLAARARRRGAAIRSTPISTSCSCIRDPEVDRHRCGAEITDAMSDAAVAAIVHLDQLGTPGLLDRQACRAMWRRGHRELALDCAARAGWTAA